MRQDTKFVAPVPRSIETLASEATAPEMLFFRATFDGCSPLNELVLQ